MCLCSTGVKLCMCLCVWQRHSNRPKPFQPLDKKKKASKTQHCNYIAWMPNSIRRIKADFENTNVMNMKRSVSDSHKRRLFLPLCLPLFELLWYVAGFQNVFILLEHCCENETRKKKKVRVYFWGTISRNCIISDPFIWKTHSRHVPIQLVCTHTHKNPEKTTL